MGFFKKKICCICGEPTELLPNVMGDGSCVCCKCAKKIALTDGLYTSYNSDLWNDDMTIEKYQTLLRLREDSKKALASFTPTRSFYGKVHIDEDSNEIVFYEESYSKEKEATQPPVFNLSDIVLHRVCFMNQEVKDGLLGKYVVADIVLVIAFKEPFSKLCVVNLNSRAKMKITGVIKLSFDYEQQAVDLLHYLSKYDPVEIANVNLEDGEKCFWQALSCAYRNKYYESTEVSDVLKQMTNGDKAKMKEIRKQYNLY